MSKQRSPTAWDDYREMVFRAWEENEAEKVVAKIEPLSHDDIAKTYQDDHSRNANFIKRLSALQSEYNMLIANLRNAKKKARVEQYQFVIDGKSIYLDNEFGEKVAEAIREEAVAAITAKRVQIKKVLEEWANE